MSKSHLAPSGKLEGAYQTVANDRSRINSAVYKSLGLRRSHTDLGPFLRQLALHPEKLPEKDDEGYDYNMPWKTPIRNWIDHQKLYTRHGKPYAAVLHPYSPLCAENLKHIGQWAEEVGLEVRVDACSEYYPSHTLRIILYQAGTKLGDDED